MHRKLKLQDDGYHFCENSDELYNPFSLLKAFQQRKVGNYWFESGTPSFLIRQMQHFRTDITALDEMEEPAESFDVPTEAMTTALPLLYQSGYLTIKGYDREAQTYLLSMLNVYVRTQVKCAGGRADMVVHMPGTTYVFELKVNGTAGEALKQIDDKDYAIPYQAEGRRVVEGRR